MRQSKQVNESELARKLNVVNRTGIKNALEALEEAGLLTTEISVPLEKRINLTSKGIQVAERILELTKILTQ